MNEAEKRGILVEIICEGRVAKLSFQGHEEYLYSQVFSRTSSIALSILGHKDVTKMFLEKAGISVAKGKVFKSSDQDLGLVHAKTIGFPIVLKPVSAYGGVCVFTNINTEKEFIEHWAKVADKFKYVLVEQYFDGGKEYRVLASRDKILAVANRVPANVVGDNIHNIEELINIKNSDPRRGDNSYRDLNKPLVKIIIDDTVKDCLAVSGLKLTSIPKEGEIVFLRENSNLSTGGDSIDCTDIIHPSVREICLKAAKAIPGMDYGGIDFLTKDITKQQDKDSYIIIEINVSPGIFMHHYPYEGTPRDVAGGILDIAFPETKKETK